MVDTATRLDAVVSSPPFSRISSGSIIAGTLCAFALQLLFNMIGVGIGLSSVDFSDGNSARAVGIGAGIWWGLSAIISLIIGGWIAGRLAGVPLRIAAALHGASVWALATILTVWLATSTITSAVSGAFGAVGQIGQVAGSAIGSGAQALGQGGSTLLADARSAVDAAGQQRQSVMRSIRNEAGQLINQVVSPQDRQAAAGVVEEAAGEIVRNPANAGQELNALVDRLFAAEGGVISEEDRQEVVTALQQRLGISQEEAEQIAQNWQNRYETAVSQVQQRIEGLQQRATEAAEATAEAVGAAAGWTSLALALGLVAAVIGGLLGKPQPWIVEAMEEEEQRTA